MTFRKIRIPVISFDFRIIHFILMIGSALLLFSALGLDDDEGPVSAGLNMYLLHRNFGLIWGAILVTYGVFVVIKKRRVKILEPLGRPLGEQIREGFSVILKYFFHIRVSEKIQAKMGRHNVMASYAFLMLILGLFLLGIGGVGLSLATPGNSENEVLLAIHLGGVGLLALFVLAHGFAVINRSNWPLIRAVLFDGKVRKDWAEYSMPTYTKELTLNTGEKQD